MKYLTLSMAILLSGCASTSDIEGLQTQLNVLSIQQQQNIVDIKTVDSYANNAEVVAITALRKSNNTEDKIDRMFKKSMSK